MRKSSKSEALDIADAVRAAEGVRETGALKEAMRDLQANAEQMRVITEPLSGGLLEAAEGMRRMTQPLKTSGLFEATERMRQITEPLKSSGLFEAAERMRQITEPLKTSGLFEAAERMRLPSGVTSTRPPRMIERSTPKSSETRYILSSPADLGRVVRTRRQEQGLSQQDLADAAGTGRRFISELEAGKATLELGKVILVCAALGLDLSASPR